MKKIFWATDLHLDCALAKQQGEFLDSLKGIDHLIVSGDIANGKNLKPALQMLDDHTKDNYYFVLGNHDYYDFFMSDLESIVERFCKKHPRAKWLTKLPNGFEELYDGVAIVGDCGWYDCRYGTANGYVKIKDFNKIRDFKFLPQFSPLMFDTFHQLSIKSAKHFKKVIPEAFKKYDKVVAVMHVPPFKEASWHNGQISNRYWLPYFTSKAVGDTLEEIMSQHSDKQLVVLCGHTHSDGIADISHNLRVYTGKSEFLFPALYKQIDQTIWS